MNAKTLTVLTASALMMTACGASTGTMGAVSSAVSSKPVATSTAAFQPGDSSMTCDQLKTEIASLDSTIAEANKIAGNEYAANYTGALAKTAATEGMVRSGALGAVAKVPFGGLLAKGAIDAVGNSGKRKVAQAKQTAQDAGMRRTSLMGIYTGKSCE